MTKSAHEAMAVMASGWFDRSLMNFARCFCDSAINASYSLASKAAAAAAFRLLAISRSHTSRISAGRSGCCSSILRYSTAMSP